MVNMVDAQNEVQWEQALKERLVTATEWIIKEHIVGQWNTLQIDLLKSDTDTLEYSSHLKTSPFLPFNNYHFTIEVHEQIEKALTVSNIMPNGQRFPQWNKARVTYVKYKPVVVEYKYCDTYAWFSSFPPEAPIIEKLGTLDEAIIKSWAPHGYEENDTNNDIKWTGNPRLDNAQS